jgi:hypothetical protein
MMCTAYSFPPCGSVIRLASRTVSASIPWPPTATSTFLDAVGCE